MDRRAAQMSFDLLLTIGVLGGLLLLMSDVLSADAVLLGGLVIVVAPLVWPL